jgi:hypothetical protein
MLVDFWTLNSNRLAYHVIKPKIAKGSSRSIASQLRLKTREQAMS